MQALRIPHHTIRALILAGLLASGPAILRAAQVTIIKADTTTLNTAADWSGTAPAFGEIGRFDATLGAANAAALTLGGNVGLDQIQFGPDLTGGVSIGNTGGYTLTLGSVAAPGGNYGIDMNSANTNVTLNCNLTLGTNGNWNVASGRTLTINGVLSGTSGGGLIVGAGGVVNLNGGGAVGGGTVAANYFSVGSGTLNISTAALTVSPLYRLNVGWNNATPGILNISNTTLTLSTNTEVDVGGGYNGGQTTGTGVINIGGTSGTPGLFNLGTTTGTFKLGVPAGGTGSGTVNLNAYGTLATSRSITQSGLANAAIVNFNGGTLKLTAAQGTWIGAGVMVTNNGGGTIDCQTFAGTVVAPINGMGSLTKLGSGTLTLSGANTFSGAAAVSAGKLIITTASIGGGAFAIANGAALNVKVATAGQTLALGSLTLGTSAASALEFDNGALANPAVAIGNATNLTLNGTVTVNIYGTALSAGTFDLLAYGSKTGSGTWSLGTLPAGVSATLNDTGTKLQLVVSVANTSVVWRGYANNIWDVGTTLNTNWLNPSTLAVTYYGENSSGGPAVLFDDTAAGSTAVALGVTVKPTSVTLSNNTAVYSLTGAGKITGAIGLTKNGTGTFTLGTSNDFTGTTTINAGTLALASGNNRLPTGTTVNLGGPAALSLGGNSQLLARLAMATPNNTATISNGNLTVQSANDLNLVPVQTINQTATLNMSGLASFSYNSASKNVVVGGGGTNANALNWILSASSNQLTANYLNLSMGGSGGNAPFNFGTMLLGQTNILNLGNGTGTAIMLGGYRGCSNNITYQAGLSSPGLRLRATNGVSRAGDIIVSQGSSGTGTLQTNNFDFGVADVLAGSLILGDNVQAGAGVNITGNMTMSGGTLDATSIVLGRNNTAAVPSNVGNLTGSFTQSGGQVTVSTLTFGNVIAPGDPTGTLPNFISTYTLNGGGTLAAQTLNANPGGLAIRNTSVRSLVWNNGTLRNYDASTDLTISGANLIASTTNAGRVFLVDAGRTITVLSAINQGSLYALPIVKNGPGTLDLQGTTDNPWFTLNVSNGVVLLDKTSAAGVHAIGCDFFINGGTLKLAGSGGDQIFDGRVAYLTGGSFDLNGQTETIGGLAGPGGTVTDTAGYGALTLNVLGGTNFAFGGALNSTFNLTKTGVGKQTLYGTDSRAGVSDTVDQGILEIGNGGATGTLASGVTVNANGTLAFNRSGTLNFAGSVYGPGAVAQNGTGVLILGTDGHTGPTWVNSGTLAIGAGTSIVGGSPVTVQSGATLDLTPGTGVYVQYNQVLAGAGLVKGDLFLGSASTLSGTLTVQGNLTTGDSSTNSPGGYYSAGTIAVAGSYTCGNNSYLVYDLANVTTPGGGTNDLLTVSGNFDLSQPCTLVIHGTPTSGTYILATFGSFTGAAANLAVSGSARFVYTVTRVGNTLRLGVTGNGGNLVWRGDGGNNFWDADPANKDWLNTGTSVLDAFNPGDNVTFNDTSANPLVNLTAAVLPNSLTINATSNYTFANAGGSIDGPVALTKTNSGTLTIESVNNFSGPVNLNGGTLAVAAVALNGTPSPLGIGSTLAFNGGTFAYTGVDVPAAGFNRQIALGPNGGTFEQASTGGTYFFLTNLIAGGGSFTKVGVQQLIFGDYASGTGNNTYTGITYVSNGQLQIRHTNALGSVVAKTVVTEPGEVAAGGGLQGAILEPFDLSGNGAGNGALQANDGGTLPTFAGVITLVTNAGIGGGANLYLAGPLTGPGMLSKVGGNTVTLLTTPTYLGGTYIASGFLQLGTNGTTGWLPPQPLGAALTNNGVLTFNRADTNTYAGSITGSGRLQQSGTGTTILTGSNDFTGNVNINAGALRAAGDNSLGLGNVYLPGGNNYGTLELAGNCLVSNNLIQLPMHNSHTPAHIRNVSGTNTLAGTLDLEPGGTWWDIASDGGYLIVAANLLPSVNAGGGWRTLNLGGTAGGRITGVYDQSQINPPANVNLEVLSGTWTLATNNNYAGSTLVDAGATLLAENTVDGSATGSGTVTVNGTLGGNGFIGGPVAVNSGATLAPGTSVGTLTLANNLTLAGNVVVEVDKGLSQSNDYVVVNGVLTNSAFGTVTVSNLGPALAVGDKFTLFSKVVLRGSALTVTGPAGVTWVNNLSADGSIVVASVAPPVNPNPTNIVSQVVGTNLVLSWPTDHTGWRLLVQTNHLPSGVSTNPLDWGTVAGSATTNSVSVPINPAQPAEFYRLVYP